MTTTVPTPGMRLSTSVTRFSSRRSMSSKFCRAVIDTPSRGIIEVLNLKMIGSSMSSGRNRLARSSESRMSFAASSRFVPHLNLQVTSDMPSFETEESSSRLLMVASTFSILLVTADSTSLAEAPEYVVITDTAGISISGIRSMGRK